MPSIGDTYRAAVRWALPELVEGMNVLAFRCSSGTCTDAEFVVALAAWLATAYAHLQPQISTAADIADCTLTKVVYTLGKWTLDATVSVMGVPFVPANINDMLPHSVAAVTTMLTNVPKCRGRVFLPGFAEDQQDESILDPGAVTNLSNFANQLLTAISAGAATLNYVILQSAGGVVQPIGYSINNVVGSQRKRKPGVGI